MFKTTHIKIVLGLVIGVAFFQNCSGDYNLLNGLNSESVNFASNQMVKTAGELVQEQTTLLNDLKFKSCMFNSLLYPAVEDFAGYTAMLKRSSCKSLPRTVETWNNPPNFSVIRTQIQAIRLNTGKVFSYGMFIAESIKMNSVYADDTGRPFNFPAMCEVNSQGRWGEGTCVPSTATAEYQRYLRYIVAKAIDVGITDILFGQLDYLDVGRKLPSLINEFRNLAALKGRAVIFGGQPNTLPTDSYLKNFDYVITPLYVDRDTTATCASGSTSSYCIVVWYHDQILAKSNAVVAEFDWSSIDDDIHRFAKKNFEGRKSYILDVRKKLAQKGVGVILPFRIPLNGGSNGNCFGYNQWVFGSNSNFSCKDETYLSLILDGTLTTTGTGTETTTQTTTVSSKTIAAGGLELSVDKALELTNVKLLQQGDGNLVVYSKIDGRALWSTKISGKNCYVAVCKTFFQHDGNLVQYLNGIPYWSAVSNGATQLIFQDKAPYLRALDSTGKLIWSSGLN